MVSPLFLLFVCWFVFSCVPLVFDCRFYGFLIAFTQPKESWERQGHLATLVLGSVQGHLDTLVFSCVPLVFDCHFIVFSQLSHSQDNFPLRSEIVGQVSPPDPSDSDQLCFLSFVGPLPTLFVADLEPLLESTRKLSQLEAGLSGGRRILIFSQISHSQRSLETQVPLCIVFIVFVLLTLFLESIENILVLLALVQKALKIYWFRLHFFRKH